MFICVFGGSAGVGKTLLEAFEECQEQDLDCTIDEAHFYEATRLEVEMKIEKKQVPVKAKIQNENR